MTDQGKVIIDASNIAWTDKNDEGKPQLANILTVIKDMERMGYEPVAIADASLRHDIDDPDEFERLEKAEVIRQSPAGTDADKFILEFAARFRAPVVSNDQFQPWQDSYPWIRRDRIRMMIIDGKAEYEFPEQRSPNGSEQHG